MSKKGLIFIFSVISILGVAILSSSHSLFKNSSASVIVNKDEIGAFSNLAPKVDFGFLLDTFYNSRALIKENEFLADILLKHHVSYDKIHGLALSTKEIHDVKSLRANKPYTILNRDSSTIAEYFIYEPSAYRYVIYDLINPEQSKVVEREVEKVIAEASGIIESSLWTTMVNNGLSYDLTSRMEDALAWSVDFHHIQKGDKFKLIYEQDYIKGKPVGIGDLQGAYYKNADHEYYAIYFENERHHGFFDLEGRPMKKAFLKSPVKYSRISSRFGMRRHPILKRMRKHLGTDYAAPSGTPIMAVADGVVSARAFTRNNGRYVKIKHDGAISTQYLHMSKFNSKVKKGSHVKQGQVIGYVGKTGLATGNHVCYRFWKNGVQVNPLKQNLPPPDPMPESDLPRYFEVRDSMKLILDKIDYRMDAISTEYADELKEVDNSASNP